MRRKSTERVLPDALTHFAVVGEYGRGDTSDQTVDAICMRLSAGITALSGLAPELREDLFGDLERDVGDAQPHR
jgi:hypothetical protein